MIKFFQTKVFKLIFSVIIGLLFYFFTPPCLSRFWCGIILGSLFLITNISQFISKITFITHFFRIFVGGLFIFSGMIKSNDPTGFSYKLQEYMEVFTADLPSLAWLWEYFAHHSLGLAIVVCVSEVALGFMLLIGWKKIFTLWLLLGQILFFTFLTFYSACYSKVTGCGCFGDFIKLAPWESFWKDIVLLISIAFLFAGKDNISPAFKGWKSAIATLIAIGVSIWFPIYTNGNLPVKDFLAYAEGKDICKGQLAGPNYKPAVYMSYFTYKNRKTKADSLFDQNHMPWQDSLTWKYVSAEPPKLISKEIDGAAILGFSITDLEGNELKDSILANKNYYFLLICYDLDKTEKNEALQYKINEFYLSSQKEKLKFIAVSAATTDQINKFKHEQQALYDFSIADGVMLKTMIRSNPGLFLMKGCQVVKKWHYNNFPSYSDVKYKYMK